MDNNVKLKINKKSVVLILIWVGYLFVFGFSAQLFFRTFEEFNTYSVMIREAESQLEMYTAKLERLNAELNARIEYLEAAGVSADGIEDDAEVTALREEIWWPNRQVNRNLPRTITAVRETRNQTRGFYVTVNVVLFLAAVGITMALEKNSDESQVKTT